MKLNSLYPYLYYVGQRTLIFNNKNYLIWVFSGILQSFMVFIITHYIFSNTIISKDGYNVDMWMIGITRFTWIILITNLRLIITTRWFTWITFCNIFLLSIFLYYGYTWFANYMSYSKTYGTSATMHTSPLFYLSIILWVGAAFVIDLFIETIKVNLMDRPASYVRKILANKGQVLFDRQVKFQKMIHKYEVEFVKQDFKRESIIKKRRDTRMEILKHSIKAQEKLKGKDSTIFLDDIRRKLLLYFN